MVAVAANERDSTESANGARLRGMGLFPDSFREAQKSVSAIIKRRQGRFATVFGFALAAGYLFHFGLGLFGNWQDLPGYLALLASPVLSALFVIAAVAIAFWLAAWDIRKHEIKKAAEIEAKLDALAERIVEKNSEQLGTLATAAETRANEILAGVVARHAALGELNHMLDFRERWTRSITQSGDQYLDIQRVANRAVKPDDALLGGDEKSQRTHEKQSMEYQQIAISTERMLRDWHQIVGWMIESWKDTFPNAGIHEPARITDTEAEAQSIPNEAQLRGSIMLLPLKRAHRYKQSTDAFFKRASDKLDDEIRARRNRLRIHSVS